MTAFMNAFLNMFLIVFDGIHLNSNILYAWSFPIALVFALFIVRLIFGGVNGR